VLFVAAGYPDLARRDNCYSAASLRRRQGCKADHLRIQKGRGKPDPLIQGRPPIAFRLRAEAPARAKTVQTHSAMMRPAALSKKHKPAASQPVSRWLTVYRELS
jgi:hypothetical protein